MGIHPSCPDTIPAIGPLEKHPEVIAAFGHSHYGRGRQQNGESLWPGGIVCNENLMHSIHHTSHFWYVTLLMMGDQLLHVFKFFDFIGHLLQTFGHCANERRQHGSHGTGDSQIQGTAWIAYLDAGRLPCSHLHPSR